MPRIQVNGIQLYYEIHGQGYPVVFSHGFTSSSQMWQEQVSSFSQNYQLITYDVRGHGQTESPATIDAYSADIVVEDLFQLLTRLGIRQAVIGGLSLGGYLTLRFYFRHPDMVKALIIMDCTSGFLKVKERETWNKSIYTMAGIIEKQGMNGFKMGTTTTQKREVTPQNITGIAYMARKVVAQTDSLVIKNLRLIKVPALVIVGDQDSQFLDTTKYMAETIPGAKYAIIPQAGHSSNQDNPRYFNKIVLDFLGELDLVTESTI